MQKLPNMLLPGARSTTSQEHLEVFMLLATEKDILMALDTDGIINKMAEKSALMRRLFTTYGRTCYSVLFTV